MARQNFAAWLTSGDSKVPADHWQKLAARYDIQGPEAEANFWAALFWGRLPDTQTQAELAAQLASADTASRARVICTLLSAPAAQLA